MNPAYKSDAELCKWLRDNSSGDYRRATAAAELNRIFGLSLEAEKEVEESPA